jgi:glycosyltransferase involved in cell wall biosynthesis
MTPGNLMKSLRRQQAKYTPSGSLSSRRFGFAARAKYNCACMRIGINAHLLAFTENYRQAGLSRYIYELMLRLPTIEREDCFTVFVGDGPLPAAFLEAKPANLKFAHSRLPTAKAPVRIAWEQTILPLACKKERLDLLHCPVNVRPFVSPCPTIVTIHDLIFLRYPENFKPARQRYLKAMTTWSARHATHIIAVSETTRRDTIELLGVRPDKVTTVHNGVSERFKRLPDEARVKFMRDKQLAGRVILYVGTLEPRKNLVTLLRAFAAISEQPAFSDVTLVIGGSKGWYYEEIFNTAEQLGLTALGRVRFLGRVPDDELPMWYNIASIFAYPSLYEGFGLPALEALACGTPVVVSNTSCFPEVVGNAGVLLDPRDVRSWAESIRQLLTNLEVTAELSKKGLTQATNFSWDQSARKTAGVYKGALER